MRRLAQLFLIIGFLLSACAPAVDHEANVEELMDEFFEAIEDADHGDLQDLYVDEEDAPSEADLATLNAFFQDVEADIETIDISDRGGEVTLSLEGTWQGQEIEEEIELDVELDDDTWYLEEFDLDDIHESLAGGMAGGMNQGALGGLAGTNEDAGADTNATGGTLGAIGGENAPDNTGINAQPSNTNENQQPDNNPIMGGDPGLATPAFGSDEEQITALFNEMVAAIKSGDYQRVKAIWGEEAPSEEEYNMMAPMMQNINFQISNIVVTGNTATADIRMTGSVMGESMDQVEKGTFVKENGKWRPVEDDD